jgi:hypothetical protein
MLDLGLAGGKRRRKTIYGQSENEVLQKLGKLRAARDRGLDLLAPSWTMGQRLDAWLSEIKKFDGTRPATLTLYKGLAEGYVKARYWRSAAGQADPAHAQRLVTETRAAQTARGTPPSATTVQHVYKVVRNALADAYRMDWSRGTSPPR